MTFPSEKSDDILWEGVGTASDDIYEEDYTYSTDWLPTRDIRRISVAVSTPSAADGKVAVEEGFFLNGETAPRSLEWHELPEFVTTNGPPGHGGTTRNMTSGQVLLTGRYFRVHVYGFAAVAAVHLTVRRIERNLP